LRYPLGNYALPSGFSNIHSLSDWRRAFNDFWRSGIGADIQDGINYTFSGQMDIEDECGCRIESLGIGGAANADRRSETTSQSMIDNVNYVSLINNARSEYGKDATIGMLNGEYPFRTGDIMPLIPALLTDGRDTILLLKK